MNIVGKLYKIKGNCLISCYEDGVFELPNLFIHSNNLDNINKYCLILSNENQYNYIKILVDNKIYYTPKYELEYLEEIT